METNSSHPLKNNLQFGHLKQLISLVEKVVIPDVIYLLGSASTKKTITSLFCPSGYEPALGTDYFILVLLNDFREKSISQWQDQIEQVCNVTIPVSCIVLETATFHQWLKIGHRFARLVAQSGAVIYNPQNISFSPTGDYDPIVESSIIERQYQAGFSKTQEFLAGADLYRIRKHYSLALFMLHQATEQALGTLLKKGMGYYCCSHNIERLLRYVSWVDGQVRDLFPMYTESEKKLFTLLQKAYIDSRYRLDYTVHYQDLVTITERVRLLVRILENWGKKSVSTFPPITVSH
jgi:uncharacterized protein